MTLCQLQPHSAKCQLVPPMSAGSARRFYPQAGSCSGSYHLVQQLPHSSAMLSLTARGGVRAATARLPVACTATARRPPAHGRIAPLQLCAARAQLTAAIATRTSAAASAPVGFGSGSSGNRGSGASGWLAAGAVAVGALTGAVGLSWFNRTPDSELRGVNPPSRPDLPTIPLAEVRKHDTRETGMWCTYRGAVYDATPFLDAHPGGTCTRPAYVAGVTAAAPRPPRAIGPGRPSMHALALSAHTALS